MTRNDMMEFLKILLPIILCLHALQADRILNTFIRDHFAAEHLNHINVFACYDDTNAVEFVRNVMQFDNVVSYNSISSDINLNDILRVNYYHVGVVLDFDCPMSHIILDKFSRDLMFNQSYIWLLLTNSSSVPVDALRNVPLTIAAEFTVAIRDGNEFELYDVYNPSYVHGGVINITYKGHWSQDNGLKNQLSQYKYRRRGNLNLIRLNLAEILIHPPTHDLETYLMTPVNRDVDTHTRCHWLLAMHMKDLFNFSYTLKVYDKWDYPVNGTYDGLTHDLLTNKIDLTVAPFRFKQDRFPIIKHTVEAYQVKLTFIFLHPARDVFQNNFLKPFEMNLWWMIMIVGFIYWISIIIITKCGSIYKRASEDDSIDEIALVTVAALSQQGMDIASTIYSSRIAILSLFVWSLFLFQFYSASIVGSLLTPTPRWITTLKNLTDSNIECANHNITYLMDVYATFKDPEIQEMYEKKIKPTKKRPLGGWMSVKEGLERIRKGGFAFHLDVDYAYRVIQDTFTEDEICELQEIDLIGRTITTMATPRHSPFNKMFVWGLRKILEGGLAQRQFSVWRTRCPQCPESHSSKPTPVGLEQFSPALFLLLIGAGFALVIMILEHLHYNRVNNDSGNKEYIGKSIATLGSDDTGEAFAVNSGYQYINNEN